MSNRLIKFRAWATDTKEMIPWEEYMVEWFEDDDIIVMQFTGLLDKNEKEIYEGDIVKEQYDDWDNEDDMVNATLIKKYRTGAVEYIGRGFWITGEHFGWEGEGLWNWNIIEVIGNIYENPELASLNQGTEDGNKKQ